MPLTPFRPSFGAALLFMAAFLAPLSLWAGETGRVLAVTNPATGLRAEFALDRVERITIRFFHSYDRHWVSESFRVARGRLAPVEVSYSDDTYDYRDQRYESRVTVERERVRLSHIRPAPGDLLTRIETRVAFTKPQQLILATAGGSRAIAFTRWGKPGQKLILFLE